MKQAQKMIEWKISLPHNPLPWGKRQNKNAELIKGSSFESSAHLQ
jgi:hypothetical protein